MLELRVRAPSARVAEISGAFRSREGVDRLITVSDAMGADAQITCELDQHHADDILGYIASLGIADDDVRLIRVSVIPTARQAIRGAPDESLIWADLVAEARTSSRPAARYLTMMAVAGIIAAFGVIQGNLVLIVGAMAVSPDLLPLVSACVALVRRHRRLLWRSLATLAIGLVVAQLAAFLLTSALLLSGNLGAGYRPSPILLGTLVTVDFSSAMIAFVAGIAAMLAFETRAGAAVGVAISVTTIPAAAFFGVALAAGEVGSAVSALEVLAVNVAFLVLGGAITLLTQEWVSRRLDARAA